MKTTLTAAGFALATTALSLLLPSAPAVAEANRHGYVNYRNYDEGPESLAAFHAYHHNARLIAAGRAEPGRMPATARAPSAAASAPRTTVGIHCGLTPGHC